PLARSVSCCAVLDSVLAGGIGQDEESFPEAGLRFGVLEGYTTEYLDPQVAESFQAALTRLSQRGIRLTPVNFAELDELPEVNRLGGIVGAEAYAWHRPFLESRGNFYDPWIKERFAAGKAQSAADYLDVVAHRERIVASVANRSRAFDALVMPTVQITPPRLSDMDDTELSNRANMLSLRNTAVGNFLDRPAISIPCHIPGTAPVGFMLMGETMADRRLLSIARSVEFAVRAD
ncbi:MAG: amidase family protein, partial [Burkholderiaceae bacterium]